VGFIGFAFRQGTKVKPDGDNPDKIFHLNWTEVTPTSPPPKKEAADEAAS
jgi:hypothetical protein